MKSENISVDIDALRVFIAANPAVKWQGINLNSPSKVDVLNWGDLVKDSLIKEVKAYQRLFRLVGENKSELIFSMLENNLHSAIQIAAMPKQHFFTEYSTLFFEQEKGFVEKIFKKAKAIRSQILLSYMQRIQTSEPHSNTMKSLQA